MGLLNRIMTFTNPDQDPEQKSNPFDIGPSESHGLTKPVVIVITLFLLFLIGIGVMFVMNWDRIIKPIPAEENVETSE